MLRRLNWLNLFLAIALIGVGFIMYFAFRKDPTQPHQSTKVTSSPQQKAPVPANQRAETPKTPAKPPTPPATNPLPNTGPGDTFALAAVVTAFSTSLRYRQLARKPVRR